MDEERREANRPDPSVVARHPQDRLLSEELMQERREEAEMADRE